MERAIMKSPPYLQRIAFAIYCSERCGDLEWQEWANKWMTGKDRSSDGAEKAAESALKSAWLLRSTSSAWAIAAAAAEAAFAAAFLAENNLPEMENAVARSTRAAAASGKVDFFENYIKSRF